MARRLICVMLSFCLILSSAAFAEYAGDPAAYEPLYYEMNNNDGVRAMQARLKELGFFDSYPSGGYYKVTADAVKAFQQAAGLEVNRKVASAEMLNLLFSDKAPTADGGVFQPTPEPTPEPTGVVLVFGTKDSDGVRQMQKRLAELGYFTNSITGNFFEGTQKAVEEFQQAAGLTVSGRVVTEDTLDELYSESAPASGALPSATVTPLPTATPVPQITQSPDATPRPALTYGTTSDAVKEMQRRLADLKYFSGSPTGGYWGVTVKAVAEFQEEAGLTVNGRCASSETLELLFSPEAPVKGGAAGGEIELTTLYFGQSGSSAVRAMQDRLRALGYFSDVSTGGYYRMTAQAVAAFQEAAGLTVSGNVASVETLKALYADDAPVFGTVKATATPIPTETPVPTATAEPTETPAATETPEPTDAPTETPEPTQAAYDTLRYSMTNSDAVRRMQVRLNELGYLSASATGGYWSQTVKAVKAFLADQGMSGDGKTATPEMQALLFGGTVSDGETEAEETYEQLTYGLKRNAAVKAMQTRLRALGYFDESSTGNYYSITANAVAAFQKAAGLTVDGNTATAEMQKLLFSANAPAFGATATPPETGGSTEQPEVSTSYQALSYGMQNSDEVRAMQKKLKERGFFSGNATGGYWSETKKAVAAFQEYAKLTVNGKEASSYMLGLLFYTGDLDALIASGGTLIPDDSTEDAGDTVQPDDTYDPEKYANANKEAMLYSGCSGEQTNLLIMRLIELGYLTDGTPTSYDSSVVSAVKWFQNTNMLTSDGIAGPATLALLYSANAMSADDGMKDNTSSGEPVEVEGEEITVSIGSVLNVDFFSTEGDVYYNRKTGQFRDGATAIITDVDTGISFRVKRSGGYNHADVEPLTAFDTWQMYRIYGKEWSWKRHAIYVTLESGVTLAGSMNGMPHGSGGISDNNFDGHFCIHFLNSRTHGSDKVDPDHQAAVSKAAK